MKQSFGDSICQAAADKQNFFFFFKKKGLRIVFLLPVPSIPHADTTLGAAGGASGTWGMEGMISTIMATPCVLPGW